jgi:hypothetical protein
LVDGDDVPIVGEHHCAKKIRGHNLHSVDVATYEQYVVIEWSIYNLSVNEDSLSPKFNRDILKEAFRRGWESIIISESDDGWYKIGGSKFLPYSFGHDAFGGTFINDTVMNCDVPNFNWYLEIY